MTAPAASCTGPWTVICGRPRKSVFLGEEVTKYHRTLTTYLGALAANGFEIIAVEEPQPSGELLNTVPGMRDELRRPMMLIISARKK